MRLSAWISSWILLSSAVLLLGFELSMLAIGLLGARVSPAYQDYFIDQRSDRWGNEAIQVDGPAEGRTNR